MIIEISGIDGSGKSTQIAMLARLAQEAGVPCYERPIRSTCRRVVSGIAAQLGLASWRTVFDRSAVELATALEAHQMVYSTILSINFPGQLIVTDTYVRNLLAVAIAEGGAAIDQLVAIYATFPRPDVSVHLDVPIDEAYARIEARPKGDHLLRTGGQARLQRLADAYDGALNEWIPYPCARVSSEIGLGDTFDAIVKCVISAASQHDEPLAERLQDATRARIRELEADGSDD